MGIKCKPIRYRWCNLFIPIKNQERLAYKSPSETQHNLKITACF